jgi:DnaB-like helicase C terminal domain
MSQMFDSEPETFYPLLYGMIRAVPATDQETLRARAVMKWCGEHGPAIANVLDAEEAWLFHHVMEHWRDHHDAPSRTTLEALVRKDEFPEGQLAMLDGYDAVVPDITKIIGTIIEAADMGALLQARVESWQRQTALFMLREAQLIVQTGLESGDYRNPMRKGVKDMRDFLLQELFSGAFTAPGSLTGGSFTKLAGDVKTIYQENKEERLSGKLMLPTGINWIDQELGGLHRRTLNLILGYVGQRKSSVARTIAIAAAKKGFRVLFMPLEGSVREETGNVGMMEAHAERYHENEGITTEFFNKGFLSEAGERFLDTLAPDLKKVLGDNLAIRSTQDQTWPVIRGLIEAENANGPLDMLVLDYCTLIDVSAARDNTVAMHQVIKELKQLTLNFDGGRGLTVVSPVQGNRKGYEKAKVAAGEWESNDIWQYSELEKSADTVMYTFQDDPLSVINSMKIGFCKHRRAKLGGARTVSIDPLVGLIDGSPQTKRREALERNKKRREATKTPEGFKVSEQELRKTAASQHDANKFDFSTL